MFFGQEPAGDVELPVFNSIFSRTEEFPSSSSAKGTKQNKSTNRNQKMTVLHTL
jgi:hypothetical protein